MPSIDWRQINWLAIVINAVYVLVLGLIVAFIGRALGMANEPQFNALFTVVIGLITVWVGYRVASRVQAQPVLHGFFLGLLVGMANLALNYLTLGLSTREIAGFMLQVLGGTLGGRMAQRAAQSRRR